MEIAARTEQLLGTAVQIKLPKERAGLFSGCFEEIARVEKAYSRFLENSELSILNKKLGAWQAVSQEFLWLLLKAEEFKEKTGGNFNIALKSVLDNMGYDREYSFVPKTPKNQKEFISSVQGTDILIDKKHSKVMLNKEIEFGGFGKGFALDKVRELLESKGVMHYYINAGGDIFARKGKNCERWDVLLEHPDDSSKAMGKILLDNCSIAGSAPNRRKWGKYHHMINAKTGKPANDCKAIFVIAKTGLEADAYATALFTAGFEEGIVLSMELAIEALIVSGQNKIYQSKGFGAELFG